MLAGGPLWGGWIAGWPGIPDNNLATEEINDYTEYLSFLASQLKNYTSLMAYDLINEPGGLYKINTKITKFDVCNMTKQWYNAIKDNDSNHLVTMGAGDVGDEGQNWDVSVMKLDFISPHVYPNENDYETAGSPNGYSRVEAYERWKAQVYWISNNMTMPWLIGETGFSALDDISHAGGCTDCCVNTNPACTYAFPPYEFGTEQEQKTFAINSQKYVWDCGGNGYSYWIYQAGIYDGDSSYWQGDYARSHYLPILYSDIEYTATVTDIGKPAVAAFSASSSPCLLPRVPQSPPNNY